MRSARSKSRSRPPLTARAELAARAWRPARRSCARPRRRPDPAHRVEEVRRDFVVTSRTNSRYRSAGCRCCRGHCRCPRRPEAVERRPRIQLESSGWQAHQGDRRPLTRLQPADGLTEARRVRIADVVREAIEISQVEAAGWRHPHVERVDPATVVDGDLRSGHTAVRNPSATRSPLFTRRNRGRHRRGEIGVDAVTITVTTDHGAAYRPPNRNGSSTFYRGDAACSLRHRRHGLGLAIVKHISAANHGVESASGAERARARRVTIRLPLPEARITISHPGRRGTPHDSAPHPPSEDEPSLLPSR